MRQIAQNVGSGDTVLMEVARPAAGRGRMLIRSTKSLISAGTERMLVEFGRAGSLAKARQQPEKVRQVVRKVGTDGLAATVDAVRSKLDEPMPLGYCNVGVVAEVGPGVSGFAEGDRVVSNGPHAEMVAVPQNLCARVPDGVTDDTAVFAVIGAIGLQGLRLAQPTLGECFVVTGLGLVGLVTVQLLRAHGCRVLGIDPDPAKRELARRFGATVVALDEGEDPVAAATEFSRGRGVDGVLLTLAAKTSEPVSQAAQMCRKRGRIVLVGVTGLELNRADFYEKELSFQVSCSYGPGRYDLEYEERGKDYPVGFVRWTEQRNFEAVLDMMASGVLDMEPLISHRFRFEDAPSAYELLATGREPYLGILLEYESTSGGEERTVRLAAAEPKPSPESEVTLGVIGSGNYASRVLIPAFRGTGASLHTIANNGGIKGVHFGRKFGFQQVTTDVGSLINGGDVNTLVVATRHDSHAGLVSDGLQAGKHVFCEKPLALTHDELERVRSAWEAAAQSHPRVLAVGFNRRFSPLVIRMKTLLAGVGEPKSFVVTVNAGAIPPDHWIQDPKIGGGRIVGEACHFVDLLRHLAGSPISGWHVETLGRSEGMPVCDDKTTILLRFDDGSVGTIHYLANGHASFPKERIEVFCAGRALRLDNFRALRGYGWPGFRRVSLWRQDKGQGACAQGFVDAVRDGSAAPIAFDELMEVSRVSIEVAEAARA